MVGNPLTGTSKISFYVKSILAIIKFLLYFNLLASISYFGASVLQWAHQGA